MHLYHIYSKEFLIKLINFVACFVRITNDLGRPTPLHMKYLWHNLLRKLLQRSKQDLRPHPFFLA